LGADVGEGQARAIAVLILPKQGDTGGVGGEGVNRCTEIEMFGSFPLEVTMQFLVDVRPSCGLASGFSVSLAFAVR
jgi:hypothetical protein